MHIKDIPTYDIKMSWKDDPNYIITRRVAVARPAFLDSLDDWTDEEERYDYDIFFYYSSYSELDQQLKDGKNTNEDFIVHQIYNN